MNNNDIIARLMLVAFGSHGFEWDRLPRHLREVFDNDRERFISFVQDVYLNSYDDLDAWTERLDEAAVPTPVEAQRLDEAAVPTLVEAPKPIPTIDKFDRDDMVALLTDVDDDPLSVEVYVDEDDGDTYLVYVVGGARYLYAPVE